MSQSGVFRYFMMFGVMAVMASVPGAARAQIAAPPAKQPELEYAYPDQSIWTTKVDENGDPENPLLRLAAAIFDKTGIPWHSRRYPAERMFNYLNDGTAEFSMLVKAPSLSVCCLVSRQPVVGSELRVYYLADKPPIKTREDLIGKRVITIRGYSYGDLRTYLSDPANAVVINPAVKHDAAFAMLEAGRGDYLLDYIGPAHEVLSGHPIPAIRSTPLSALDVYLVLAKTYPDAKNVMARLEAAVETLNKEQILGVAVR